MADSTYPSPLAVYEGQNLPPLPMDLSSDGKSMENPPAEKPSDTYEKFTYPLDNGRRGGFDVHVYFTQENATESKYAKELFERIRREFPELRIYAPHPTPIGPHPVGQFEINLFTPSQYGAFIPWLLINRGPLSVLVHPNTEYTDRSEVDDGKGPARGKGNGVGEGGKTVRRFDGRGDHTTRAMWMGEKLELKLGIFKDGFAGGGAGDVNLEE